MYNGSAGFQISSSIQVKPLSFEEKPILAIPFSDENF
jgi:hypothetical protein